MTLRLTDELWADLQAAARREGAAHVSEFVRSAIRDRIRQDRLDALEQRVTALEQHLQADG